MNDLLYYLVSPLVVLSLIFGIMCLVKLFKKDLSKAYVVKRLKLFAGILAFIVFILYPISAIRRLVDYYSFPIGLRLCIAVDVVAFFIFVIYSYVEHDKLKKSYEDRDPVLSELYGSVRALIHTSPVSCPLIMWALRAVHDEYDKAKEGEGYISMTVPTGDVVLAYYSDTVQFSLIALYLQLDDSSYSDFAKYILEKLYYRSR